MSTQRIPLSSIEVADRLRAVEQTAVDSLVLSIASVGLLSPITVTKQGERYRLVAGAHRLAAAHELGWTDVPAEVIESASDDEDRLREIDENLYRRELSPYDRAVFLTEREAVCVRLGRVRKRGGDRRSDQAAKLAGRSYDKEIAEKFGISGRDLSRSLRRRRDITEQAWAAIRGTKIAENGAWLDALARVEHGRHQLIIVEAYLADPGAMPFTARCRESGGSKPVKVAPEAERRRDLLGVWRKAEPSDIAWLVQKLRPADLAHLDRLVAAKLAGAAA